MADELTALRNRLDQVAAAGDERALLKLADAMLALAGQWVQAAARLDVRRVEAEERGLELGPLLLIDEIDARSRAIKDCAQDLRKAITTALLGEV